MENVSVAAINDGMLDAPTPVLKTWVWLLLRGGKYVGTPSGMYEKMSGDRCMVSRRNLPIALSWLGHFKMVTVERKGSYLSVELNAGSRA